MAWNVLGAGKGRAAILLGCRPAAVVATPSSPFLYCRPKENDLLEVHLLKTYYTLQRATVEKWGGWAGRGGRDVSVTRTANVLGRVRGLHPEFDRGEDAPSDRRSRQRGLD